jgi:hypothetical protein
MLFSDGSSVAICSATDVTPHGSHWRHDGCSCAAIHRSGLYERVAAAAAASGQDAGVGRELLRWALALDHPGRVDLSDDEVLRCVQAEVDAVRRAS